MVMAIVVLTAVMAILLLGGLFLALMVYTLHSRGSQSRQSHMSSGNVKEEHSHHQAREQHCCMCGNLRNRKSHVEAVEFVLGKEGHGSSGKLWRLLQPFVESACENSAFKHGNPHIPRETSSLNLFENLDWNKLKDIQTKLQSAIAIARSRSSSSNGNVSSIASSLPSDFKGNLKIDREAASTRSMGSSSPVFPPSLGSLSSEPTLDWPLSSGLIDGARLRQDHGKKLVLEILVSPSQAEDGNDGQFQLATGVRLKLETNTSLESLASFAAAASSSSSSSGVDHDAVQRIETDSRNDTIDETFCKIKSSTLLKLGKDLQISDGLIRIDELDIHSRGHAAKQAVKSEQSNLVGSSDLQHTQNANLHKNYDCPASSSAIAGRVGATCMLDSFAEGRICDGISLLSTPQNLNSSRLSKLLGPKVSRASIHTPETFEANGGITKATNSGHTCIFEDTGKESCRNGMQQVANSSSPFKFTSLECLDYLQIRSLEAGSKSKSYTTGGTADIASALTALTVDSIGENSTGRERVSCMSLSGDCCLKGLTARKNCKKPMHEDVNNDEAHMEESGSEQGIEEVDEHHSLLNAQSNDNQILGSMPKKEKKKKKNRRRRQNAKMAVASGSGTEVQAPQESSKCLPVSCKHNERSHVVEVGCLCGTVKEGLHSRNCPYPFTSSGSMIQRKLKEQYDDLVCSNINKTLTLAQVGRFTTCLVEAKASLQHKSDLIQRKFTIAKSLLCKADKSSFDRLCGQIYGFEVEQRRIEEDTLVYNRLQEQLKLSPAYQKMLEYGQTHFQLQPNTGQLIEKLDGEAKEISFEELLAQEKKDSFWQKHTPSRSSVQVN